MMHKLTIAKVFIWVFGLSILGRIVFGVSQQAAYMGANPLDRGLNDLGWWALCSLTMTLALTPMAQIFHQAWLKQLQRLIGLFSFAFLCCHVAMYVYFDQELTWSYIVSDITQRRFILFGFSAFIIMMLLAITSTQGWQRRLKHLWKKLHRGIYLVGILGILHFVNKVKVGLKDPEVLLFALVVFSLLAYRIYHVLKERLRRPSH